MKPLSQLVRPNIQALQPYSTARDEYAGGGIDAWLDAIDRQEQRQLANLLTVIATGSQGTGEAIRKAIQSLTAPCSKSP